MVAGLVHEDGAALAGYQVHWTLGEVERHGATFFVILGSWGDATSAADRFAVALRYRNDAEAKGFMVIDAGNTSIASHSLVGRALGREEVVGTPLARGVFDIVDLIWLRDDRVSEVTSHRTARSGE